MEELSYKFKNEYGCFGRIYSSVFGINPDNEQDFSKIYEESFEICEVI